VVLHFAWCFEYISIFTVNDRRIPGYSGNASDAPLRLKTQNILSLQTTCLVLIFCFVLFSILLEPRQWWHCTMGINSDGISSRCMLELETAVITVLSNSSSLLEAGVVQSVQRQVTGWMAEIRFRQVKKIVLYSATSKPPLGPSSQPPIQIVAGVLSPEVKWPGREAQHSPSTSA
jgi:hypothetical protein